MHICTATVDLQNSCVYLHIFTSTDVDVFWIKICKIKGVFGTCFKQQVLVFKQHYMYFHTFFYPHVFSHMFSNNNFQFLCACTKGEIIKSTW